MIMLVKLHTCCVCMSSNVVQATNLCNAWVGTLDIPGRKVQPAAGVRGDGRTVLPHGAPTLTATPATLELPFSTQTHATAVPLGTALVQMHCRITNNDAFS